MEEAAAENRARPPKLRGELVTLEPLAVEDARQLAPLLDDPALHEFIGGAPLALPELEARYRRLAAGPPRDSGVGWFNWTMRRRVDSEVVGTAQATVRAPLAQLAWVIAARWQGCGYASDAARAMAAWAAGQGLTATARIHPDHSASERVAIRAGLRPTDERADGERVWIAREGRLTLEARNADG